MYEVDAIENIWIPMSDGIRLAARLWLPRRAAGERVPAILEYVPYHKRDLHRASDDSRHPHWAAHGYGCLRVDIRGSGDSDGEPQDEYVQQEQDDGAAIIAWIAAQPWCTGAVGMVGISWGGINALQIAARNPPALKAIITHCSTPDRYAGDAHYKGGCMLVDQQLWGTVWLAFQATPPDPSIVGVDWLVQWQRRLQHLDCNLAEWMDHPHRDAFWRHASVAEDYAAVRCPVYAVGGFADPYATWVFALLENLTGPRKGLVGPWGHSYPHEGEPAPAIDYLTESLRWWNYWLKGEPNGVMDEPALHVWIQDTAPLVGATTTVGRWVAEPTWPSTRTQMRTWALNAYSLDTHPASSQVLTLSPVQTIGISGGRWVGFVPRLDLPAEQSVDDARALCFDSQPLNEAFDVLGQPLLEIDLAVDQPVAFIVARLNEVTPAGESHRVSFATFNLCHRDSHCSPSPVTPGRRYTIRLALNAVGHRFQQGQRLRVALSTAYWPTIMPAPAPVTLKLYTGISRLLLPVRMTSQAEPVARLFNSPAVVRQTYESGPLIAPLSTVEYDPVDDVQTTYRIGGSWTRMLETGTEVQRRMTTSTSIRTLDPAGATVEQRVEFTLQRDSWRPKIDALTRIQTTCDSFEVYARIIATDGERVVATREFRHSIARRLV